METFGPKEIYLQYLKGKIFKGEILLYETLPLCNDIIFYKLLKSNFQNVKQDFYTNIKWHTSTTVFNSLINNGTNQMLRLIKKAF